jgi:hypothetical protein
VSGESHGKLLVGKRKATVKWPESEQQGREGWA